MNYDLIISRLKDASGYYDANREAMYVVRSDEDQYSFRRYNDSAERLALTAKCDAVFALLVEAKVDITLAEVPTPLEQLAVDLFDPTILREQKEAVTAISIARFMMDTKYGGLGLPMVTTEMEHFVTFADKFKNLVLPK
jgi:hypothetical protein